MRRLILLVRRRILTIFIAALSLFALLFGRVAYVQLIQGEWLAEKARDLWQREIAFAPPRGKILDRHGEPLTYNISVPSVLAIPVQVKDPVATSQKLAKILEEDPEKIYKIITARQMLTWIRPAGRKITEEKAKAIQGLALPGIVVTDDSKRYYPYGSLAAHLLGFTGIDNQGLAGLELIYDKELEGKAGHVSFSSNARGERIAGDAEEFKPPTNGLDLMLTLDKHIQTVIERELDQVVAQYNPENVLAIAMDPNTGEILGMSSRPTFHPDKYKSTDSEVYNRNLPIWKTYEPGSTFKIITMAAALEENKLNLKAPFFDAGSVTVGGARLRCWKSGGHGSQTFLEVAQNSCNPGFVALGERLGKKTLLSYIRKFGFGEKTGVDLNGEAKGILFKESRMGPVELATTAFGQGVSVTPIQQVAAIAAAVNGGKLFTPHIAKAFIDEKTGEKVKSIEPEMKRQVISEKSSQQIRYILEHVVAQGTGRKAFIDGFRVGGKTGTAQKVGPDGRYMVNNHIVSFIGTAPSDNPRIVVYLAVDNPQGIQFGGLVVAPVVGRILDDTLRYLQVPRSKDQVEPTDKPPHVPLIEVPDLVGEKLDKIRSSLYDFPLRVYGSGSMIIDQLPKAGQRIEKGSYIHIYLSD